MKRIRVSCGEETYTASVEPSASDQFLVSKRLGFGSWEREVVVSVRSYKARFVKFRSGVKEDS
ncbi:hypothetical protein T01_4516 [Trichinella spiralis]|uniref:Uncharacterized protein n=1 Tax=Trichinella spiralis TaxID=6334 RepID=A0A0V1BLR3_TRISP|nr:hypothetical protein T01_4516 [Trichinella spiralis]